MMLNMSQSRDHTDRIIGALVIDRFELKLLNSSLHDVDQFLLDDLADIASEILDAMGNSLLTKGFLIPKTSLVQMKSPRIQMMEHTMLLETYFVVDERLLERLAKQLLNDLGDIN